jgi:protein-disulfide isomerase
MLTPPVSSRDYQIGPPDAPAVLVEYGDYECPYCGEAQPIVVALQKSLPDSLLLVFRNFPLAEAHPHAENSALAAESAGAQGKFWEMHDTLYDHQDALDDDALVQYAGALGLDLQRFVQDMRDRRYENRMREDFRSGVRSGVNGTPTFFINGRRYDGQRDLKSMLAAIKSAVAHGRK